MNFKGYNMQKKISELLMEVANTKKREDKINLLRKYGFPALRTVLYYTYSDNVESIFDSIDLPKVTHEPYDDEDLTSSNMWIESTNLYMFFKKPHVELANKIVITRAPNLYEFMGSTLGKTDLELLEHVVKRKAIKGVTKLLVEEAFPDLLKKPFIPNKKSHY